MRKRNKQSYIQNYIQPEHTKKKVGELPRRERRVRKEEEENRIVAPQRYRPEKTRSVWPQIAVPLSPRLGAVFSAGGIEIDHPLLFLFGGIAPRGLGGSLAPSLLRRHRPRCRARFRTGMERRSHM